MDDAVGMGTADLFGPAPDGAAAGGERMSHIRMERDGAVVRTLVDLTAPAGRLVADVEGLTLFLGEGGTGYLIASSQGNHTYNVYRREGRNEYVGSFRIVGGDTIDGTEETDGIDVCAAHLGPGFEWGVFVAQDGLNDDGAQNFKLVPWQALAVAFEPALSTSGADTRD